MASYDYIGYAPGVINVGLRVTLSSGFDPATDRVIFEVNDPTGGNIPGQTDDGTVFNGDQTRNEVGDDLTQWGYTTDLDGNLIAGATNNTTRIYLEDSYSLNKPGGGTITLYRVEIDGALVGYITSEPLVPGVNYVYSTSNVTPNNAPDTDDLSAMIDVPCFVAGTMIRTPAGDQAIETLEVGDLVETRDGPKAIRWTGRRTVLPPLARRDGLWPVRIARDALGADRPDRALMVSPNHRMLIEDGACDILFGVTEVLVAAKFLTDREGIEECRDTAKVTYVHLLFDDHQIITANNAPSESLYPGDVALNSMAEDSRDEILGLFPELAGEASAGCGQTAARILRRHEAAVLLQET